MLAGLNKLQGAGKSGIRTQNCWNCPSKVLHKQRKQQIRRNFKRCQRMKEGSKNYFINGFYLEGVPEQKVDETLFPSLPRQREWFLCWLS